MMVMITAVYQVLIRIAKALRQNPMDRNTLRSKHLQDEGSRMRKY